MTLNGGYAYRDRIGLDGVGMTVLAYLSARHRHSSREQWCERLRRGELELNGTTLRADVILEAGRTLVWHRPPWDEPDVPRHYDVLHEDASLVAVIKPRGLPTMAAGGFLEGTLLTLVRARYPDARPLHRLGRHTSGIVLFARTHAAAALVSRAWRDHAVGKRYRALGAGIPEWETRAIEAPIGPVAHPVLGTVHAASSTTGKRARSVAHVIGHRGGMTLFDVDIATGRPHQVRIHLACAGHPLVGDPLYAAGGAPRAGSPGLPGDGGYLLHAARLRFVHPLSKDPVELAAPPPADLCTDAELRALQRPTCP
jgi:23S rRNA pseudouridine1911/1915/1917 synthase